MARTSISSLLILALELAYNRLALRLHPCPRILKRFPSRPRALAPSLPHALTASTTRPRFCHLAYNLTHATATSLGAHDPSPPTKPAHPNIPRAAFGRRLEAKKDATRSRFGIFTRDILGDECNGLGTRRRRLERGGRREVVPHMAKSASVLPARTAAFVRCVHSLFPPMSSLGVAHDLATCACALPRV